MIGRRLVLATTFSAVTCGALAQGPSDLPRLALIDPGEPVTRMVEGGHPWWDALLTALRDLGHVDGATIVIEPWSAAGQQDEALQAIAAAIVASAPDVIVARGTRAASILKDTTATIPLVSVGTMEQLVASLARPGGNLTGINTMSGVELAGKPPQLLADIVPGASRLAWLGPADYWRGTHGEHATQGAAELGLTLVPIFIEPPTDEASIRRAFATIADQGFDGVYVSPSGDMTPYRAVIAELALAGRLPAVGIQREYAVAGVLIAFGPDYLELYRRAAGYVDRILDGANPADMPIEQPTQFEFVVNLRTAASLGLTLPPEIMLAATELIE